MRLTKPIPTVVDTPRDSLIAQMISWDATLVAVVAGPAVLAVLTLLTREVRGAKEETLENGVDIIDK